MLVINQINSDGETLIPIKEWHNSAGSQIYHKDYDDAKEYLQTNLLVTKVYELALIKEEWLLPLGGICLAVAILADRFLVIDNGILDFIVGVFTGMSMVLNLVGLWKAGRKLSST
jgi:hypothetical protein